MKRSKKIKKHKADRFNQLNQPQQPQTNEGNLPIIYIGHLPHGFYQKQLKIYFSQYGQIKNIKVARSRKTSRSKGYAFVQFDDYQIAKIAANAMHNYMVNGKILVCHLMNVNPFKYKLCQKKYTPINWRKIFTINRNRVKDNNQQKSKQEIREEVKVLLAKQQQKRQKLIAMVINYPYPGFSSFIK